MDNKEFIEGDITRAEVVTILYILSKKPKTDFKTSFTDVKEDKKYYDAISWAQENGIAVGYSDGSFKPESPITTQQLIAILALYAKYKGIDITSDNSAVNYNGYDKMSSYAEKAYSWALDNAIYVPLDGDLHAKDYVTREEMTKIIMNYDNKYGMNKGSINNIDTKVSSMNSVKLEKIVNNAKESVFNNLPYVDPNVAKPNATLDPSFGTDSPGFINALYASQDIKVGNTIEELEKEGASVIGAADFLNLQEYPFAINILKPGDIIICNNGGHVVMYIGDNKIIHESYSKKVATEEDIEALKYMPGIKDVRRIIV